MHALRRGTAETGAEQTDGERQKPAQDKPTGGSPRPTAGAGTARKSSPQRVYSMVQVAPLCSRSSTHLIFDWARTSSICFSTSSAYEGPSTERITPSATG